MFTQCGTLVLEEKPEANPCESSPFWCLKAPPNSPSHSQDESCIVPQWIEYGMVFFFGLEICFCSGLCSGLPLIELLLSLNSCKLPHFYPVCAVSVLVSLASLPFPPAGISGCLPKKLACFWEYWTQIFQWRTDLTPTENYCFTGFLARQSTQTSESSTKNVQQNLFDNSSVVLQNKTLSSRLCGDAVAWTLLKFIGILTGFLWLCPVMPLVVPRFVAH